MPKPTTSDIIAAQPISIPDEAALEKKRRFQEEYYSGELFDLVIAEEGMEESLSSLLDQIDACGDDPARAEEKAELVKRYRQLGKEIAEKTEAEKSFTHRKGIDGCFHFTTHSPRYTLTRHIKDGKYHYDFFSANPNLKLFVDISRLDENGERLNPPAWDILCFRNGKLEAVTRTDNRGYSCVKEFVQTVLGNDAAQKLGQGLGEGQSPETAAKAFEKSQQTKEKHCLEREKRSLERKGATPQHSAVERYAASRNQQDKQRVL